MRTKGTSCHQCKSKKSSNTLVHCSKLLDKNQRQCRKKYCLTCLSKYYSGQLSNDFDKFVCPSCKDICVCASCSKRYRGIETPGLETRGRLGRPVIQRSVPYVKKRHYGRYVPPTQPYHDNMSRNTSHPFNPANYGQYPSTNSLSGLPPTDVANYMVANGIDTGPMSRGYYDAPNEDINNSFLTETEKELLKPLDIRKLLYSRPEYEIKLEDPGYIARIPVVKEQIQIILHKDISEQQKIESIKNLLKEYRSRLRNNVKPE